MHTFNTSKSSGSNRTPTNILKEIHEIVFIPLSTVINKLFITGVFPDISRIAVKVEPISKSETQFRSSHRRCSVRKGVL